MPPLQILIETCFYILFPHPHEIAAVFISVIDFFLLLLSVLFVVRMVVSAMKRDYFIISIQLITIIVCFVEFYFGYDYIVKRAILKNQDRLSKIFYRIQKVITRHTTMRQFYPKSSHLTLVGAAFTSVQVFPSWGVTNLE